jgi:transcriptional regulator with XRE-family HTH domain
MPKKYSQEPATPEDIEFVRNLFTKNLTVPNVLTIGMGNLIKEAREEAGFSQNKFAKQIGSDQSTISDIEKGKNEIGIMKLTKIALALNKPVEYFFPKSIISSIVTNIQNEKEEKLLMLFREIELEGDPNLVLEVLETLQNYMSGQFEKGMSGDFEEG